LEPRQPFQLYQGIKPLCPIAIPNFDDPAFLDMPFPFCQLPIELTLEILRFAASPAQQTESDFLSVYATARALALVCYNVRQVVMPHFLHTVVLNSHDSLNKFVRTLDRQKQLANRGSRLFLNYAHLVHRVWTSRCWEPIYQTRVLTSVHAYTTLSEILCNAEALGFTFLSYHLLYEVLSAVCDPIDCRRLTFAGNNPRWNPLISTAGGQAFLQRLTHLTIWLPADDSIGPPCISHLDGLRVPNWVQRIPFEYMTNLTHFAFSLVSTPRMRTTAVVMYVLTPYLRHQHNPTVFRTWATSEDPLSYGKIVNIDVRITNSPEVDDEKWGMAFLRGENDMWPTFNNDSCL
jgi:hypothetical protein